jgi:GH24 family phage-related lysozyme (muramidase)
MKTSDMGRDMIKAREGYSAVIYNDVGHLAGGWGHDLVPSDGAHNEGDAVALGDAQKWFDDDIAKAESIVNGHAACLLTQNQFDALVSATYNLGFALWRNADGSYTHVALSLQVKDYLAASVGLAMFDKPASIIGRRKSEVAQFLA